MLAALGVLAALVSAGLLMLLSPWLKAYALARPNARSSHTLPTPQGGGAAVVAATCVTIWAGVLAFGPFPSAATNQLLVLTGSTLLLAIVGAIDDVRGLSASARLALQGLAVAGVIASLPPDWQVFHFLPWWIERIVLVVGG